MKRKRLIGVGVLAVLVLLAAVTCGVLAQHRVAKIRLSPFRREISGSSRKRSISTPTFRG